MSNPIIHKKSKSILFKDHIPELLDKIPRSKAIVVKGQDVTAIVHGEDEVLYLHKNGYPEIPSPIETYYDFPKVKGKFDAFAHQKVTAGFITLNKRSFVFNEVGMGKTESIMYAIDYLMKQGKVKKALLVSPLSTIEKVWADAVFHSFYWRTYVVLHGTAARRKELLAHDVDLFIINYDGLKVLKDELLNRSDINFIAYDEAAILRTGDTKLYDAVKALALPETRLVLATGTPTPNGPEGAWSLAKLVNPTGVPKYFGAWKRQVMHQLSRFKWVPKYNSHIDVNQALQPAILFKKSDCLDLPPCTIQKRECQLSPDQKKAFKEMKKEMEAEIKSSVAINAVNGADRILKLLQIVGGSVKDPETGEYHDLDCHDRINTLVEIIEEASKKVIVFADFTGPLKLVTRELNKRKIHAEYISGEVPTAQRNEIFDRFQNTNEIKVLVCNSRTVAHGLTLTAASVCVWYIPPFSLERFLQGNGRIDRPSQDTSTTIFLLGATAFEWEIYERLVDRNKNLTDVLDLYKQITESKI